ncbi:2'-5' RNA ligase family protein [Altericista sp. CCNU0014]|uniref:2'-5' RNA ligase family protein n=1 Tax=Altericista sp. CCNU0014 TaxID=3082949 RepID=UPI00384E1443
MADTATAPFAVWLVPAPSDRRWLSKVIQDYAVEYDTPVFEPHLTLYSGDLQPEDNLEEIVAESAATESPITLEIMGLDYAENYFRTGFITFAPSDRLARLSRTLRDRLSHPKEYTLDPHLSLMYKDIPIEQKRLAMLRFVVSVQTVTFDTIEVVMPSDRGWLDVAHWTEQFRYSLAQSAPVG